jgi:hypothetical protein
MLLTYGLIFVPVSVIARLSRTPALGGDPDLDPGWMPRSRARGRPMPKRGFGPEPRWRRTHRSPVGVACTVVVALVIIDVVVGSVLTSSGLMPPVDRGGRVPARARPAGVRGGCVRRCSLGRRADGGADRLPGGPLRVHALHPAHLLPLRERLHQHHGHRTAVVPTGDRGGSAATADRVLRWFRRLRHRPTGPPHHPVRVRPYRGIARHSGGGAQLRLPSLGVLAGDAVLRADADAPRSPSTWRSSSTATTSSSHSPNRCRTTPRTTPRPPRAS